MIESGVMDSVRVQKFSMAVVRELACGLCQQGTVNTGLPHLHTPRGWVPSHIGEGLGHPACVSTGGYFWGGHEF